MSANLPPPIGRSRMVDFGNRCKTAWLILWVVMLCGLGHPYPTAAGPDSDNRVAVVVSQKIRPYMDAVQGVTTHFEQASQKAPTIYFMEPEAENGDLKLTETLTGQRFTLMIAVGPEAMEYLWTAFPGQAVAKVFCMVLDPRSVVPPETELCGVALDIPAADQLREFTQRLPFLKRLGLVYNPAHNAAFAADAQAAVSAESGIRLIGLKVGERADILALIERQFHHIDTLWVIPDRTVVSESLIPFIIKAAMAKKVAVFGYNRYFADCGAAISLVRDYQAIGDQTAAMALRMLAQPHCRLEAPRFTTSINPQVLEKLGYPALPPTPADTPAERP